ncbi:hypothetical protein [Pseudomonas syringae]|uniref:Uncharacterized protein n=1 Tax=Pseudomonas syringae TaxID=317 RepID=A0A085V8P3_PSESX|nr:hypothetical protein [Pseudomonas syringae]KFE51806.1 hypothetical protein IV02_11595 [Pseudomonas syringae]
MRDDSFEFDRQLYRLLCQEQHQEFTTRQLRDAYAATLEPGYELGAVRIYVYEQIRRLIRAGWISKSAGLRKRGQVFRLLEKPARITLVLVDSRCPQSAESATELTAHSHSTQDVFVDPVASASTADHGRIEEMLKETRLDLLSSMGETERYKQLFEEMPHLKNRLEGAYHEVRDRSSRLLGHLRALETTLKAIAIV